MSLVVVAGLASQWTAAGGGDTSGTIVPTSNVSITPSGMQGGFGDLDDDPDSPDGNWLLRPTAQDATLTDATFGMSTPSGTPGGTDAQEVRVLVRKTDRDGVHQTTGVDPTVSLLIDGTVVLTDSAIGDVSSVVLSANFDDAVSSDWSTLEVRVQQTGNGGGSPPGRRYVEVGAIEVNWSAT